MIKLTVSDSTAYNKILFDIKEMGLTILDCKVDTIQESGYSVNITMSPEDELYYKLRS